MEDKTRTGIIRLFEASAPNNVIRQEDGSLLIKDVTFFTPGIFVDSLTKESSNYSEEVLSRDYANWIDTSVWSKHSGGMARDITEKIGKVLNLRYMAGVIGDIILHCKTQQSRDVASMVESREVDSVSAEMTGEEKWNPVKQFWDQVSIKFLGLAVVNQGACPGAKLFEKVEGWEPPADSEKDKGDMNEMDAAEMEKQIAVLRQELAETKKELSAVPEKLKLAAEKGAEEASTRAKELAVALEEQKARIAALETDGAKQRSHSDGADKEMEEWQPNTVYDPVNKITRSV
jgi:hypothetical protein